MSTTKVYVVGNSLVEEDSLALRLVPFLQEIFPRLSFEIYNPVEEVPLVDPLVFLDCVEGLSAPRLFFEMENFSLGPSPASMHDLDLLTQIRLLREMGELKEVVIVGVPQQGEVQTLVPLVIPLLQSLVSKNVLRS